MDMTSVRDFVGITPKFIDLNGTADIEALHALTVPSAQEVADDPSIKFKGKIVMALPPFLMKTHIDMDFKDPFKLFKVAWKALNDYDNKNQPAIVPCNMDLQAEVDVEAPDMAKAAFLYVTKFLYLTPKNRPNQVVKSETTTTSCPMDWAQAEEAKYGVAMISGDSRWQGTQLRHQQPQQCIEPVDQSDA